MQNSSFERASNKNRSFIGHLPEKLQGRGKTNRVLQAVLPFFVFMAFFAFAQETDEFPYNDEHYFDLDISGGFTVFAVRPPEFPEDSVETYVMGKINGFFSVRKEFIGTEFLEGAGFRRSGNARYRQTTGAEKTSSVLHGIASLFSFGIVPMKPYAEIDYDRLPKGKYYDFGTIIEYSRFKNISPDVLLVMELEYMLQIYFCNGIVIRDNLEYYTGESISHFEERILDLPYHPDSVWAAKSRFLNELQRIKAAYERYKNPGENYSQAYRNLWGN